MNLRHCVVFESCWSSYLFSLTLSEIVCSKSCSYRSLAQLFLSLGKLFVTPYCLLLDRDQFGRTGMEAPSLICVDAPLCLLEVPIAYAEEHICLRVAANKLLVGHVVTIGYGRGLPIEHRSLLGPGVFRSH